ncbi:hypothetical protein NHX12_025979 [Muraenolepis orangiensis]|uniref:KASH domain-containing protein n=1 Tax=Muraenolepis orangiensis TaxID=630683 RepID=A0A9Q0EHN8_9TELE|nr:hypothetical protein NHX12_025979 [Muraenolepis orangiensis]
MDAARTSLPSSSGPDDQQTPRWAAGSPGSPEHLFTMQGVLSDLQGTVERSHIINRTQRMDLTCLKSCTGESEIHLTRTISRGLGCRYRPAQLNVSAMVKQLEEAEDYRRCVQEQVAAMKRVRPRAASGEDPEGRRAAEERWSAALLDAAATVQVKAEQLELVSRYHKQTEGVGSFLEGLAGEMEKLSSDVSGSSTVQAGKISALLQTLEQKKDMIRELLHSKQEKYLHFLQEMENSRDIAEGQIKCSRVKAVSLDERFRLCQTLLVELPLVKMQCQEAADQLEAIAQNLKPSQLNSERQRIQHTVGTLVAWEQAVTENIRDVESRLLEGGLCLRTELPAMMEFVRQTRQELLEVEPLNPEEKAIDAALQRCWVIWRSLESWLRVVEALGLKEKWNLRTHEELYSLTDACMRDCHSQMEDLGHTREALKDYQWATRGAFAFLHNAEATFLSAPGGFLDCNEEQRQTQQALASLEDILQAHISHLVELVPHQPCLSSLKTEQLHIGVLSHLLVGRATLGAQAQLRLEALERCARTQQSHWMCHEHVRQLLSSFEAGLSKCASERVTSYAQCDAQQNRAKSLMGELHSLAGQLDDLRAGCPMQGCGAGRDGELSALWRRWASLCRGVGLLLARSEQRRAEWKDIATSAEMPGSPAVAAVAQGDSDKTLSWAETHQVGLEQEQPSLASLEHRLEHALSLSGPEDPGSPGPMGQELVKVQQSLRSLTEQNTLAALAGEKGMRRGDISQQEALLLPPECCSNLQQENTPHVHQHVWDGLDAWHGRLSVLESEAQDLAEQHPQQGLLLMDRLGEPLQLYQDTAQLAEQRTIFMGRIPAFLQEFEDILHSATCWLGDAQSWVGAPCTYSTARILHSHCKSLQLVLGDSERIRVTLEDLGPLLLEMSMVWETGKLEERLARTQQQVEDMQRNVYGPMAQLLHTATEIDAMELEVKTMKRNAMKIRAILSSLSTADVSEAERLHSRQVILANLQSMQSTLEEIQRCKGELDLPVGAADSLTVFHRAEQLLWSLGELEQHVTQLPLAPQEAPDGFEPPTARTDGAESGESLATESGLRVCVSNTSHTVPVVGMSVAMPGAQAACVTPEKRSKCLADSVTQDEVLQLRAGIEMSATLGEWRMMTKKKTMNKGIALEERPEQRASVLQESKEDSVMLQELRLMEREVGMGHTDSLLGFVEDFSIGQDEPHPTLKTVPGLEWLEGLSGRVPGEEAELRRAPRSFLRGFACFLDLGEERMKSWQTSRGQSQHYLSRSKKFLQTLGNQLSAGQHLFQQGEPQQARDEWEDGRGRAAVLLDELDTAVSAGPPELEDGVDLYSVTHVQTRLEACQHVLVQLEQSRAALGCLLDQGKLLPSPLPQTGTSCSTSAGPAGGALELQWWSVHRRTEQEIGRCQDIQRSWARLQSESQSLGEWLAWVRGHLETWCGLAAGGEETAVHGHLTRLLDFSMEAEARAAQKASIAREGALLLREADSPWLRGLLSALEVTWDQKASDLARAQERLQQLLVAGWPPLELLSDLGGWVETVEARLGEDRVKALQATDASQLADTLQHLQELKEGVACGQVLLDFLWQSGPQKAASQADICAFSLERTRFAEALGELSWSWTCLEAELMSQVRVTEDMHHVCAHRERRLGRLGVWLARRAAEVERWRRPVSQAEARKALLECQDPQQEEVQEPEQEEVQEEVQEHPSDSIFADQLEGATHACVALTQEVAALRPALRHVLDKWSQLETDLSAVSLHNTRLRCAVQQQLHTPAFSPKQVRQHLEELQQLQEDAGKGADLCAAVDQSFQSLEGNVNDVTAKLLRERMDGEQRRGQEVRRELQQGVQRRDQALALWQGYVQHRDDTCALVRQHPRLLPHLWEEAPSATPLTTGQTPVVDSTEKLQDFAEDLKRSGARLVWAAESLVALLEPLAANQIQSEVSMWSHDIRLVIEAVSTEKARCREGLELHQRFGLGLEALELQTKNPTRVGHDLESTQKRLQDLHALCLPLMELSELSACVQPGLHQTERLGALWWQWAEALTHTSGVYQEMTATTYSSQSFQQKSDRLATIQRAVEEALETTDTGGSSSLLERLAAHQRLHVELASGRWLLRALLRDCVDLLRNGTGGERAHLLPSMARLSDSWQHNCVAGAAERGALLREELRRWRLHKRRSRQLWRCLEEHTAVYRQTLGEGRLGCASSHPELRCLEEAWARTGALLGRRAAVVHAVLQDWTVLGDRLITCGHELEELKRSLDQRLVSEDPEEVERVLELDAVKTELWRSVAAGDAAPLERQLELLYAQWEELCHKVSSRRQEITDRLDAWTLFSDRNQELCDWLTRMEGRVLRPDGGAGLQEMVERLKKDCTEEMDLFGENKEHLQQLGELLLLEQAGGGQARNGQVQGSLRQVDQRWHQLFHGMETR